MEDILLSKFSASLSTDQEACKEAEEYLKTLPSTPDIVQLLIKISLEVAYSEEVREVVATYLKNHYEVWHSNNIVIPYADLEFLKFKILTCLSLSIPDKIRSQYEKIASTLKVEDYPLNRMLDLIQEGLDDPNLFYAALNMIYQIYNGIRGIEDVKSIHVLLNLVVRCLPKILEMFKSLVSFANIECFAYINLIEKIYFVLVITNLHAQQADVAVLDEWMICFKIILEHPFWDLENRHEFKEREKIQENIQWECKQWAAKIMREFVINPYESNPDELFPIHFQRTWALKFFNVIIQQLFQVNEKFFLYYFLRYYLEFISKSVIFSSSCAILDERIMSDLRAHAIMLIMHKVKSDHELWKKSPIEFIRISSEDNSEASCSLVFLASDLLWSLCEKGDPTKFLEFIATELQESADLVRKEAILLALGCMLQHINQSQINVQISNIFYDFMFCEFSSPIGFMRYRAVWICFEFSSQWSTSHNIKDLLVEEVCKLLIDPELPVRYKASLTLSHFINTWMCKDRLSGDLNNLLGMYLSLINEVASVEVMKALSNIVCSLSEKILPFTLELTLHLAKIFNQIIGTETETNEVEALATCALETVRSIITIIIQNTEFRQPWINAIQPYSRIAQCEDLVNISFILSQTFDYCLSEKGLIYFEPAIRLLASLLCYTPDNSMPHLYYLANSYCTLVLAELQGTIPSRKISLNPNHSLFMVNAAESLSCIGNFIQKYKGQTLDNLPRILKMAFSLLKRYDDKDVLSGCRILIFILENYKFALDSYLPRIILKISTIMAETESDLVKFSCSRAIVIALWNSTQITLSAGPLVSSALRYSIQCLPDCYKKWPSVPLQLIHGYWSLFLVVPQLPEHVLSILPLVMEQILALLNLKMDTDDEFLYEDEPNEGYSYSSPFESTSGKQLIKELACWNSNNLLHDEDKLAEFINFSNSYTSFSNEISNK